MRLVGLALSITLFAGCSNKVTDEVPGVVKNTNGGEKWETKVDYSTDDNWLAKNDTGKDVDVVYFYPTAFNK